jgi:hypothetical protein
MVLVPCSLFQPLLMPRESVGFSAWRCVRLGGLLEKPACKQSFRDRRYLIPAHGFYEWVRDEVACVTVRRASSVRTCHLMYLSRCGFRKRMVYKPSDNVSLRCQKRHRNREGPLFPPASRRIGAGELWFCGLKTKADVEYVLLAALLTSNSGTFESRTSVLEDLSDRTRSATLNKNLCADLRFWPQGFFRGSAPNLRVKSNRHYVGDHFRAVVCDSHNTTFFLSNLVMDNISQVESHTDPTPSTILL